MGVICLLIFQASMQYGWLLVWSLANFKLASTQVSQYVVPLIISPIVYKPYTNLPVARSAPVVVAVVVVSLTAVAVVVVAAIVEVVVEANLADQRDDRNSFLKLCLISKYDIKIAILELIR